MASEDDKSGVSEILNEEVILPEDPPKANEEPQQTSTSQSDSKSESSSSKASESTSPVSHKKEGSECCSKCLKESRTNGRACICQVPFSRRRTPLSAEGCITCGCHGCHPEDKDGHGSAPPPRSENLKNGCCKSCMKAFSETKKACLCQVPIWVRMNVLPPEGCNICKCKGCHPEEVMSRRRGGWPSQTAAYMYPYYTFPYMGYGDYTQAAYPHDPSKSYDRNSAFKNQPYPYYDWASQQRPHSPGRSGRKPDDSRKRERDESRSLPRSHGSSSPKRSRT